MGITDKITKKTKSIDLTAPKTSASAAMTNSKSEPALKSYTPLSETTDKPVFLSTTALLVAVLTKICTDEGISKDDIKKITTNLSLGTGDVGFQMQVFEEDQAVEIASSIGIPEDQNKAALAILAFQPQMPLPTQAIIGSETEDGNLIFRLWTPLTLAGGEDMIQLSRNFSALLSTFAQDVITIRASFEIKNKG